MGGPSFGFSVLNGNGLSFLQSGSGSYATVGNIRFPGGVQTDLASRNNAGSADLTMAATDASDNLYIGTASSYSAATQYTSLQLFSGSVSIGVAASTYLNLNGGFVEIWKPIIGSISGAVPLQIPSTSFAIAGSAVTLTATQYRNLFLIATGTPGADRTVIVPTVASGTWFFQNTSNNAQTVKTAAGTGISVATLKGAWLQCDGVNVIRLSNDF